jgi:hypothetical protein
VTRLLRIAVVVLVVVVVRAPGTTVADKGTELDAYTSALRGIARSIESLKADYPQLVEFSASAHSDVEELRITYAYRTESPRPTGGWTSGVPSPVERGVWFLIDFHDAESKAELHTQPVVPRYRLGEKRVMLLLREGPNTKPLHGALVRILLDHGVRPVDDR